jgi:hypothetical protein
MTKGQTQSRDPVTGQYAYDGDFSRMCVCGHPLGEHIAGGFECQCVPGRTCDCLKFRQSRKKPK